MKKFLSIFAICIGILHAQETTVKVVYDLTTKNLADFELKILKATVMNNAYYESKLHELEIAVVIHGGAYKFFIKEPKRSTFKDDKELVSTYETLAKRIRTIAETYNVQFLMCGSGMHKYDIKENDIYDFVEVIPNATIGLIDKQSAGYAYIPIGD